MRIFVIGAGGMLGTAVTRVAREREHTVAAYTRTDLDVNDYAALRAALQRDAPDAVVYCAGYTAVDAAENDEAAAHHLNATLATACAIAASAHHARFVYPSTDYVFDGAATAPYPVDAPPAPINAYGRSKLAGEQAVSAIEGHLIVRTSWLYGANGNNFVRTILRLADERAALRVVADQQGAPSWTRDVAAAIVRLLEENAPAGIYHATNGGRTSWHGLASAALQLAGKANGVEPIATEQMPRPARRPAYSVLDCTTTEQLIGPLPDWHDALGRALPELIA